MPDYLHQILLIVLIFKQFIIILGLILPLLHLASSGIHEINVIIDELLKLITMFF